MKVADYIIHYLYEHGVRAIFGYPGGNITHLLEAIGNQSDIQYIQGYHEQANAFAAKCYAEASQKIGVAISSSGPGATNMITGIADAYYDSVPCLFISGQVNSKCLQSGNGLRQKGFQESDIVSIVKPITKFAETVYSKDNIDCILEKAFYSALQGRPGPVLVDIPHDIQGEIVSADELCRFDYSAGKENGADSNWQLDINNVNEAAACLVSAKRPVVLVGGGVIGEETEILIDKIVCKTGIPVVATLKGLSKFNGNSPYFLGFIGDCGHLYSNFAVEYCDVLLVLGVHLPMRYAVIARNAKIKIIYVDVDQQELNSLTGDHIRINASTENFLCQLMMALDGIKNVNRESHETWACSLKEKSRENLPNTVELNETDTRNPNSFLAELDKRIGENVCICADVGQNLLWTAQSIHFGNGRRFFSSGGLGAMGFAVPAAIGCAFACPDTTVICIVGDGGLQMNLQELQTIVKYNLSVKVFVLNNHSLGMVRAYQEKWFENKIGTVDGYLPIPSFENVAYAFGLPYQKIENGNYDCLYKILEEDKPYLCEILIPDKYPVHSNFL